MTAPRRPVLVVLDARPLFTADELAGQHAGLLVRPYFVAIGSGQVRDHSFVTVADALSVVRSPRPSHDHRS